MHHDHRRLARRPHRFEPGPGGRLVRATARHLEGSNADLGFKAKYMLEPGSQFILGLVEHAARQGNGFDARVTGLDHLSLAVANRDELRAWKTRLDELGIANDGISEQDVGAGLNFRDPNGIALEFYVIDPPAQA